MSIVISRYITAVGQLYHYATILLVVQMQLVEYHQLLPNARARVVYKGAIQVVQIGPPPAAGRWYMVGDTGGIW